MKKLKSLIAFTLIILVGCNQTDSLTSSSPSISDSTSSNSNSSSSSTSDQTPPIEEIQMPKNMSDLIVYLKEDGKDIFVQKEQSTTIKKKSKSYLLWEDGDEIIERASSFERFQTNYFLAKMDYQKSFFSDLTETETIKETHEGHHYFGAYQQEAIEAWIWDELHIEIDGQISTITQYQLVDDPTQLDKNLINKNDLFSLTSSYRYSLYPFIDYLTEASSYSFHFQLKNRNPLEDFEYEISYSTYDSEYPQSNYFEITFSFIFDNEGYLKEATYFSEEFSYSYINDGYESLNQIELNFSSIKGALKEPETLPIDFEDYLLQDIEIVLTDSQGNPLNTNQIEAGAFIYVQTKNPVPETALDIEFEIVKSSNEEVIAQEYSNWSALKEGTTTLTLMNQSGFTKTIDVQVIAPPLSMILVMLENEDKLYPGNTYELSIMRIPSESTDLFEVSVENSTLATIEKIDDLTYELECLAIGTTSIIVQSIQNPDIKKILEIEIKEEPQPLPTDELIQALCQASWENYSYTIQFNEDYTGSITDNYYYDTANFTWSINETTITVSAFSLSYYDYTYNTATISEDGLTLTLNFSDDDGYSSISPLLLDSLYQKSISNSVCFFITFYPNATSNTIINTKPNIIPHVPK